MGILAYQIGIFLAIQIASLLGKGSRNTAVVLISIFSVLQVYTSRLMILQFITIAVSFYISQKRFSQSMISRELITEKKTSEIEKKNSEVEKKENQAAEIEASKEEIDIAINNSLKALHNLFEEEKTELVNHLQFNLTEFNQNINNPMVANKLEVFNEGIRKIEKGLSEYKRLHNPIDYVFDFENYIIMHNMILTKVKDAKNAYLLYNKLPDTELLIRELINTYHSEFHTYELDKEDYRALY